MQKIYNKYDQESITILNDFLPQKIFDGHAHISLHPFCGMDRFGIEEYKRDMLPIFKDRYLTAMALATPTEALKYPDKYSDTVKFFSEQLNLHPDFVGSILVKPEQDYEEILLNIKHPRIKGLKCYHSYSKREDTKNADIHEYLSEAALAVANSLSMTVTIHLVKEHSLSDPTNLKEIKDIAKRHPYAKFILAHSARAFAAWTAIEAVSELAPYENVFFDFSAICESPSIIGILKKIGVSRCLWGSDYNVSMLLGKAISLGDSFYWINEEDLSKFENSTNIRPRHIIIENLMAMREAAMLLELSRKDVEELFYNNAYRIFL